MRSRDQAETAEAVEGRELAKGKTGEHTRVRTQCRSARQRALDRIRQAARRDRAKPLTALWHHVYDVNRLREAYYGLNRKAAPGVDGQTWAAYGEHLEVNLRDLSERLKRGAYHARPVERVSIPKPDGRQRPIGIPMGHAYCTPSHALWVSEWGQAGETGPPSIRAIPYVGECRGLRCRTGVRKAAIYSGVRVIQRGWCRASWRYSSWPALHH